MIATPNSVPEVRRDQASVGEAYDFEFEPTERASNGGGVLLLPSGQSTIWLTPSGCPVGCRTTCGASNPHGAPMLSSSEADVQAIVKRAQAKTQRARDTTRAAVRRLDLITAFADKAVARLSKIQAMPIHHR